MSYPSHLLDELPRVFARVALDRLRIASVLACQYTGMQLWWRGTPLDLSALIDREREQEALRDLLDRPGPSMAVLYGRSELVS